MAINVAMEWDVRTTGSDTNGGGFRAGATGTDYSIQDAAQVVYTDLVIGGTNTQLTSAAFPFNSTHVGNVIAISGGTGFTVARYEVVSVAGVTATMDRAVGTASSTGGQGKLGGSLATNAVAFAAMAGGNTVWLKAGTYTLTTQLSITQASQWRGYATAHGDLSTRPLVTTATDSTVLATNSGSGRRAVDNINFSNTASVKAGGYQTSASGMTATLSNCNFDGFSTGLNGGTQRFALTLINVRVVNCSSVGVDYGGNQNMFYGCYFRNNAVYSIAGTTVDLVIDRCVIADSGSSGIRMVTSGERTLTIRNSTITGNVNGIELTQSVGNGMTLFIQNSIIYGNSGSGIAVPIVLAHWKAHSRLINCAFGANSLGNVSTPLYSAGEITLTADPFTSESTGDYSLNSAAGGGALCKDAGYQI